MKILVTVPAYNEENTIGNVIDNIKAVLDDYGKRYSIHVVDDGSTDKTAEVAKKHGAKVFSHPMNYGLVEAFKTEISEALKTKADIIVHIDADSQYVAEEIPLLIEPIVKDEADLVLGSRFSGEIESMPFVKRFGNRLFSWLVSRMTRIKITDAQTGFRAFKREVAEKIEIISTHTYTQEMIIRAAKNKLRIREVPIRFRKRKDKSRLIYNPLSYGIRALITCVRIYRDYEPLKFFGSIGSVLILSSAVIGIDILGTLLTLGVGGAALRLPAIILFVLLFTSGLQIVLFGFLADMKK